MRLLVAACLAGALLAVAPPRAAACSGYFEGAALRPGAVVFGRDGATLWVLGDDDRWRRVDADGTAAPLVVSAPLSRVTDAGVQVVVSQGFQSPSCAIAWHRVDRVALEPRGTNGGGTRTATPRLDELPTATSFAVTPSATRAAITSFERLFVVDFASRSVILTRDEEEAQAVWLDEDHLAWVSTAGLSVLDVRDAREDAEPRIVELSEEPARPLGELSLLPSHPGCMEDEAPRVALVSSDASPRAVTIAIVPPGDCGRFTLARVALDRDPPTVERASWSERGHLLAISRSGTRVAVLRANAVHVLDRDTGRSLARVSSQRAFVTASLSADGGQLAVASRPRARPRPRAAEEDVYPEEWDLARGGSGPVLVEVFDLRTGARRAILGDGPSSRLVRMEPPR